MDILTILNIVFYVFIGFIVIGSLWGVIVGMYNQLFTFGFKLIFILVFIFATPAITSAIGSTDISNLTNGQFTTINAFLVTYINELGIVTPINGMTIYETLFQVATQVLSMAVFLVEMLLVFLLGEIVGSFFYLLSFHFVVRKKFKKRRLEMEKASGKKVKKSKVKGEKLRRLGGLGVGLVSSFVTMTLFLSPLSSLVGLANRTAQSLSDEDINKIQNTQAQELLRQAKNADQSLLLKMYDAFGNIDDKTLAYVISTKIGDTKASLFTLIETLLAAYKAAGDSISFDENFKPIFDYAKLSAVDTVNAILDVLLKDNFLMSILPVIIPAGANLVNSPLIDSSRLDFRNINYSNELGILKEVYTSLYETGLISNVVDHYVKVDENKGELTITLNYDKMDSYTSALSSLGSLSLIQKNMAYIMEISATKISQSTGANILSTNYEDYKDIDWSNELKLMGTILLNLLKDFNITEFNSTTIKQVTDFNAVLKDPVKRDAIITALVGSEERVGLLDLQLFQKAVDLPSLMEYLVTKNESFSEYIDPQLLSALIEEICSDSDKLKTELSYILKAVPKILEFDFSKFDITDPTSAAKLKEILVDVKDSYLINNLLGNLVRSLLVQNIEIFSGIGVYNIQLHSENLVEGIISLIDIIPDATKLMDSFSSSGSNSIKDMMKNSDIATFRSVMERIIDNEVINPKQILSGEYLKDPAGNPIYIEDFNINTIIKNVLSTESMKNSGIEISDTIFDVRWKDKVELDAICGIFTFLQENVDYLFDTNNQISVSSLDGTLIANLFDKVGRSEVFRESFANIINKNIGSIFDSFGISLSFTNKTSQEWTTTGKYLGYSIDILTKVLNLSLTDNSIANYDWMNTDSNVLNALLTSLYKSGLVSVVEYNGNYKDNMGAFIYNMIKNGGLNEYFGTNISYYDFVSIELDDENNRPIKRFEWSEDTITQSIDYTDKDGNKKSLVTEITSSGEILCFANIFKSIQDATYVDHEHNDQVVTGMDALVDGHATKESVQRILYSINDSTILKYTISSFINLALNNITYTINGVNLDFTAINLNVLKETKGQERLDAINKILVVYDNIAETEYSTTEKRWESPMIIAFKNITTLDDSKCEQLEELLDVIFTSKLFSTPYAGKTLSFKELLLVSLFRYTGLDLVVTGYEGDEQSIELAKKEMLRIIKTVSDYDSEAHRMINVVKSFKGLNNITECADPSILLKKVEGTDTFYLTQVLLGFNQSQLTHNAVKQLFKKIFITNLKVNDDIKAYLNEIGSNLDRQLTFDYYDLIDEVSMNYWDNEINTLNASINEIIKEDDGGNNSFNIIDNLLQSKDVIPVSRMLYNLNSFTFVREYYFTSLLSKFAPSNNTQQFLDMIVGNGDSSIIKRIEIDPSEGDTYSYSIKKGVFDESGLNTELLSKINTLLQHI